MTWEQQLEVDGLEAVQTYLVNDTTKLEQELQPFIVQGETDVKSLVAKTNNPFLIAAVDTAVAYAGTQLPALEGDAVVYLKNLIATTIKHIEGS